MDLTKLNTVEVAEEGAWLTLEHPVTGEPLDIKIKLAGIDSKRYRNALRRQVNKRLKKRNKNISVEEAENETIELLVACTLEWENIEYEGKPMECSPENIRFIYKEFPWIKEQVDEFIADRSNFLQE